jgi:hypothetical protein
MPLNIIKYRNWVLEVESEQTRALYKNANVWGAENCGCGTCLHFTSLRNEIYPDEVRGLFEKLGIDINKEVEVCDFGDGETEYIFSWWFHFIGDIVEGDDCMVPFREGGYTLDLLKIDDVFSIGFTRNISLPFIKEQRGLIQIELGTAMPRNHIRRNK